MMKLLAGRLYGEFATIRHWRSKQLPQPAPMTPLRRCRAGPVLLGVSAIPVSSAFRHAQALSPAVSIPATAANRISLPARIPASRYSVRKFQRASQLRPLPVDLRRLGQGPGPAARILHNSSSQLLSLQFSSYLAPALARRGASRSS